MFFLKVRNKPPLSKKLPVTEASRLGVRSKTVLAKLGFDLRRHYEPLICEPLPDEFYRTLNLLSASAGRGG